MKKYMLVLAMLALTVPVAGWCQSSPPASSSVPPANSGAPATAARPNLDDPAQFQQFKANFLKNIGTRIETMQKMQTCVQGANKRQDFMNCMPKLPQVGTVGGRPASPPNMMPVPGTSPAAPAPSGTTGAKN